MALIDRLSSEMERFANRRLAVTTLIEAPAVNLPSELPVLDFDLRSAKRVYGCIGEVAVYGGPSQMTQIPIHEPTRWADDGWTAQVIKNEDDEGWAVAMIKDGEPEPALVGPWTMGRDKKNPKPLDSQAFITLVKTATEFVRRHEQQRHAQLHQSIEIRHDAGEPFASPSASVVVSLDIVPDDDNPHGQLSARDSAGELLAQVRVQPFYKLNRASAAAWIASNFSQPSER